jgi:hypothetical protein
MLSNALVHYSLTFGEKVVCSLSGRWDDWDSIQPVTDCLIKKVYGEPIPVSTQTFLIDRKRDEVLASAR